MTLAEFKRTLTGDTVPAGLSATLAALWWASKGEWDKAHALVMDDPSREAAWVHAHLHRVEGDLDNAGYWYRQARRAVATGPLVAECDSMVSEFSGQVAVGN